MDSRRSPDGFYVPVILLSLQQENYFGVCRITSYLHRVKPFLPDITANRRPHGVVNPCTAQTAPFRSGGGSVRPGLRDEQCNSLVLLNSHYSHAFPSQPLVASAAQVSRIFRQCTVMKCI